MVVWTLQSLVYLTVIKAAFEPLQCIDRVLASRWVGGRGATPGGGRVRVPTTVLEPSRNFCRTVQGARQQHTIPVNQSRTEVNALIERYLNIKQQDHLKRIDLTGEVTQVRWWWGGG